MNDDHSQLLWDYKCTGHKMGGLSVRHVYRLVDQGEITRIRIGKRSFILAESVRAYLDRLEAAAR
jgi:excisionase family DNA binding protein